MIRTYIIESFRLVACGLAALALLSFVWAASPQVKACGFKSIECRSVK